MQPASLPYQRMILIGSTGSGKTTLGGQLAGRLGFEHIEMDALYWEPGWVPVSHELLCERVELATRGTCWVADGNYSYARAIVWPRAQAVVWLDYPLATIFMRLLRRTWRLWRTQEQLCNGNREVLLRHFKLWSDESIFHWLVISHARHSREYPLLLAQPENRHLTVLRFCTPAETQAWLDQI